jgi:hypothetical protein
MQSEVKIRTFTEKDRGELRDLFGRAGEGSPSASLWGHEESEAAVYLTPYMDLEPDSLFIAEVDGALTGYLAGCLDSNKFPSETRRMQHAIRKYRLMLRPKSVAFFARGILDVAICAIRREPTAADFEDPRWQAHLTHAVSSRPQASRQEVASTNDGVESVASTSSAGILNPLRRYCGYAELYGELPVPPALRTSGCTCAAPLPGSYAAAWTSAPR